MRVGVDGLKPGAKNNEIVYKLAGYNYYYCSINLAL